MLGGIGGKRRKGRQRMGWLDGITDLMGISLSELWELVIEREACHLLVGVSYPHNTLCTVTPSQRLGLSAEAPLHGEGFLTICTLPLEHSPLVMSKATQGRGSQALLHVEII